ncbi:MAG: hypothetical protein ACOC57_02905 [Acidobacteriota bacterium]
MNKIKIISSILVVIFLTTFSLAQQEPPEVEIDIPRSSKLWEKLEIEIHYSQWTLDPLKGLFEKELIDELGDEIRREMSNQIRESHQGIVQKDFQQNLLFDSGGFNYGLELRYYPGGKEGAFSFGVSLEKSKMRLSVEGTVKQEYEGSTYAEVDSFGYIEIIPWTTNISLCWDLKPEWMVSPFAVLGLGLGNLSGEIGYEYDGHYKWSGPNEVLKDSDQKGLKQAEEDIDINLPNVILILQTHLGVRVKFNQHLHLKIEAGLWDGLLFRGGLAFRL